MRFIAKVGSTIQKLFGPLAEEAGKETEVIRRQRKFTYGSLAETFVLGFLKKPDASDEELAQVAVQCGANVTPQAIGNRHTPEMVKYLEKLFRSATKEVIGSPKALAPILERYTRVTIVDSTTITLPDSMEKEFRGCGGSYNSGKAAVKLQVELDLRSGALTHVEIEDGRSPDSATVRQKAKHPPGSLRITDLGYFNLAVFAALMSQGVHFLSRLQFGIKVMLPDIKSIDILSWLSQQPGKVVDQMVLLSKDQRLPCRLIAWRVPEEQANRRRQKLRQVALSKRGQEPSAERMAWCDWTILVTSLPVENLTAPEAIVLYRARWQIELLFKRWKSQDLVAVLSGSTEVRQMVRVWSRLLAALLQHWLVVATSWDDPTRSWVKVCEAIRGFVGRMIAALDRLSVLEQVIVDLCKVVTKTCGRNKRSKPGTVELLNNVKLLKFGLT